MYSFSFVVFALNVQYKLRRSRLPFCLIFFNLEIRDSTTTMSDDEVVAS